jgi:predicted nuclease of predicted toxin-antitoxin system
MRVLIDECLNWRICRALTGHYCASVQKVGWGGLTNGVLLKNAEEEFDVFITADSNLSFQQNVPTFKIAVIVLHAESTQLHHTMLLMPKVSALLATLKPGNIVDVYP